MYPCRAGPGDLQSRAVAAGSRWVTEFPSPAFHNPPKIKASPRKKRDNSPLPFQGPWEGGWAEIRNLKSRPWAGLRVQQALGPLGPHRRGRHLQSS